MCVLGDCSVADINSFVASIGNAMLVHYRKLCLRLCVLIQIHKWSVTQKMSLILRRDLWFLHALPEYYCCTLKYLLYLAGDLLNEVHVQNFAHPAGSALK